MSRSCCPEASRAAPGRLWTESPSMPPWGAKGGRVSALQPSPQTPLSRLSPSDSCPWRRIRVGIISSSCSNMQCLVLLSTAKIQTIFRNGFILLGFCWCSRLEILLCAGLIVLSIRNANILTMVDLGTKYENYKWNVLRRKKPPK